MATTLSDLIDPQVIADFVDTKLINKIVFAPLAVVDSTLVGKAGDTLTFPKWSYIGDAEAVSEGAEITVSELGQTSDPVTVSKIGKGVGFTDEARLSGLGGDEIVEQSVAQIVAAIASKVDSLLLTAMSGASLTAAYDSTKTAVQNVAIALEEFGEDIEGEKVLIIPPSFYTTIVSEIVPNTDNGANILHTGNVGKIMGCQVVVSDRLASANALYIVKPGALRLVMKRDTFIEFDRDKSTQTDYVFGTKLFAPYLYDESKIVKITTA